MKLLRKRLGLWLLRDSTWITHLNEIAIDSHYGQSVTAQMSFVVHRGEVGPISGLRPGPCKFVLLP